MLGLGSLVATGLTELGKGIIGLFSENIEDKDKKAELEAKAAELQQQLVVKQLDSLDKMAALEIDDAKSARELAAQEAANLPDTLKEIKELPAIMQVLSVPLVVLRVAVRPLTLLAIVGWFFYAKIEGIELNYWDYILLLSVVGFYFGLRHQEKKLGLTDKA